jgi:hypothetical protein
MSTLNAMSVCSIDVFPSGLLADHLVYSLQVGQFGCRVVARNPLRFWGVGDFS